MLKSNFSFLEDRWSLLFSIGMMAEKYIYTDPNSCLIKLGLFAESVVRLIFKLDSLEEPKFDNTHANRIKMLKNEGLLPKDIDEFCMRSGMLAIRQHMTATSQKSKQKYLSNLPINLASGLCRLMENGVMNGWFCYASRYK